jgi:hypothetical protein
MIKRLGLAVVLTSAAISPTVAVAATVNLYADHLAPTPPVTADDVLASVQDNPARFDRARAALGLSKGEYAEFRSALLDGDEQYRPLPRRFAGMTGYSPRRGGVYVVKNAYIPATSDPGMGWVVTLRDGKQIWIPRRCGNLAVVNAPAIAVRPVAHRAVAVVPKRAHVPAPAPPQAVAVVPPVDTPPAPAPAAPAESTPVTSGSNRGAIWPFFAGAAAIGAAVFGADQPSGPRIPSTPVLPPCDQGSNLLNACQGKPK